MKKIAAFIDESGDPRFTIGATKSLVFSCVILDSDKIESINIELLSIQKKLGITEFKSANIRSDERRIEILKSIIPLDLKYLILIINKENILGEWRLYPKSFYKYTQKLLHRELHRLFEGIHISIDKFGTPEYQKSFKEYIEREVQLDLFESDLTISSAKDNIIIQIADLLAGTWRKIEEKAVTDIATIKELIGIQNIYIFRWPDNYSQLYLENITNEHDREIASICIECAENYLRLNNGAMGTHATNLIVEYLLFNVKNINPYAYTYTGELINWLATNGLQYSEEDFRSNIIGSLRDDGVIIGASSKGLKIPMSTAEVLDYLNHSASKYLKIMQRSKKALDIFKAKSFGKIDFLTHDTFKAHKKLFENL